jgi:hypothetical protein
MFYHTPLYTPSSSTHLSTLHLLTLHPTLHLSCSHSTNAPSSYHEHQPITSRSLPAKQTSSGWWVKERESQSEAKLEHACGREKLWGGGRRKEGRGKPKRRIGEDFLLLLLSS